MLGAHESEKHGHVRSLTDTISVEVGADAHAVAVRTGVERRGVEADRATVECITIPPTDVRNLPDEDSIGSLDIEDVLSQTDFVDHDRVLRKTLLHRLEVLADFEELCRLTLHLSTHESQCCIRVTSTVLKLSTSPAHSFQFILQLQDITGAATHTWRITVARNLHGPATHCRRLNFVTLCVLNCTCLDDNAKQIHLFYTLINKMKSTKVQTLGGDARAR